VETEAISTAGKSVAFHLRDCGDTLASLRSLLSKLEATVKTKNSSRFLNDFKSLIDSTSGGLRLTQAAVHGGVDTQFTGQITLMNGVAAASLNKLLADCDLSEDADVKNLVRQMLEMINQQNDSIEKYQDSIRTWDREAKRIRRVVEDIRKQMSIAGSVIAENGFFSAVSSKRTPPPLSQAKEALLSSIYLLDTLAIPEQNSSKQTLKEFLEATLSSFTKEPQANLALARYSGSDPETESHYSPISLFDPVKSTIMVNVRDLVQQSEYFDPTGGFWTITTCIAICLPVWSTYKEIPMRKELIRSALFLVRGAKSQRYSDIADRLSTADQPVKRS